MVVSVGGDPHVQALERTQSYLWIPNGQALLGFNHEYKCHGTTTVFSALNVLTGKLDLVHHPDSYLAGANFWIL